MLPSFITMSRFSSGLSNILISSRGLFLSTRTSAAKPGSRRPSVLSCPKSRAALTVALCKISTGRSTWDLRMNSLV